ncbi:hypothetical protein PanWU01x14_278280 [Parasponia andersonii]|uniref:Pollen Ole e 1 allergen and extensin family protein n=1 Tax=Parasponia andersonii TaxID=3476 RepID=A0A2P5B2B8_PARAD|nr:hypothetical protein PanWU01x14_278280 [Parasponia andersonii]
MTWFLSIIFCIILTSSHLSEANHDRKLSSAVVIGTVYCDTCFQEDFDKTSHFISGASVAVECKYGKTSKPIFREEVKTNKHGEFEVHLPLSVSKHIKRIEGCSVTLISSSEPYCSVASTATSSSLHLKSRNQGTHIFSAGFFTFKPLKQPILCNQKQSFQNSKKPITDPIKKWFSLHSNIPDLAFPPPLQDPDTPSGGLPPIPGLPQLPPLQNLPPLPPLPKLPSLPNLPGVSPIIPGSHKIGPTSLNSHEQSNQKETNPSFFFPPNPFQPPPLIPNPFQPPPLIPNPFQPPPLIPNPFQPPPAPLIPNPFQPPPAPTPLIPNPFQPPPAPTPLIPNPFQPPPAPPSSLFPPFPPIPGLTPASPPPPPPPSFPFPLPPFTFPFPFPPPRSPGTPPASSP